MGAPSLKSGVFPNQAGDGGGSASVCDERDPMLSKLSIRQGLFDVSKANRMLGYSPRCAIVRGVGGLIGYVGSQAR